MLDTLFILIFITIPVFVYYLCKVFDIDLFKPSIFSISIWLYILFAYVGIFPLYFGLDDYRVRLGINNKDIILKLLLISSLSLLIIACSYIYSRKLFMSNNPKYLGEYKKVKNDHLIYSDLLYLSIWLISTIVFIYILTIIPKIPLLAAINGETPDRIKMYRSLATNAFKGKLHYYNIFIEFGLLIPCFYFFVRFLNNKNLKNTLFLSLTLLTAIFSVIYTTQKAPIVWLMIALYSIYLLNNRMKFNVKTIFYVSMMSIPVLYVFYKYFMNMEDRSISEIFGAIFSRTFSGQLTPAYYYIELFPIQIPFLHGKSFPNPGGLFPFEKFNLPVEVFNRKLSVFVAEDIVGSAPAPFWGEAFANFSWLGIIVFSIYIGIIIAANESLFNFIGFNSITLPIYVWLALEFKNIALGGVGNYLFSINYVIAMSLIIFLTIFNNDRRSYKNESMPSHKCT